MTETEVSIEREVALRDERRVVIRRFRAEDVSSRLELERRLVADGRGQVMTADDIPDDPAAYLQRLDGELDAPSDMTMPLVALAPAEATDPSAAVRRDRPMTVVGTSRIARFRPGMLRHAASLSIGIHPDWQGCGLGRAMMVAMLDWADHWPVGHPLHIDWVELYVRCDNERAVQLYASLGFEEEGRRRGFVRPAGEPAVDDLILVRRRNRSA